MSVLKVKLVSFCVLVCGLMLSTGAFAQEQEEEQGLLWEITGNQLNEPSYLYGTMHVSKKVAFHLTDTFFLGIKNCDYIALEINPDSWFEDLIESEFMAGLIRFQSSMFGSQGFYNTAFNLNMPENKDLAQVLATDHNLTNYMLYRFGSQDGNFEENTYLDLFIYQTGKKQNKKVSALEDMDEMLEMVQKASEPDEDEDNYYNQRDWYEKVAESGKTPYELLEDAYRAGDLIMLDSLSRMMNPSKNYHKYMVVERNKIMAENLDSLLQNNSVFAGVGAAHLPGDEGIINILREKGYTVRAVKKIISKKADKLKAKSENTTHPLTYSSFTSADNVFTVDVPGKILESPSFGNNKEYFYPEMVNGAYFSISRINTYDYFQGRDQAYTLKRLDSLFYENIPGKIIKKKEISNNGIPGFDILNKTRRGDFQRYNIFVTPLEVFIVKMGGLEDYVKKEGEKFFASFKFNNTGQGWIEKTSRKGAFKVSMPADLIKDNDNLDKTSSGELYQSLDFADSSYYLVMKNSLHDFYYIEEDTFELNYMTKKFIDEIDFEKEEENLLEVHGYPALDMVSKNDDGDYLFTRIIIKGADYYLLACKKKENVKPEKFFNSFEPLSYEYTDEFEEYVDTNMFFTVHTIKPPKSNSMFNMPYYGRGGDDEEDRSHQTKYDNIDMYCPQSREKIDITYFKFHRYMSYDNIDSLWTNKIVELTDRNGLLVFDKKQGFKDSIFTLDMMLTDTNSTRAIKKKLILKGGVLYTLSACVDTIGKTSRFVNTVFNSFQPNDTLVEKSIFDDKAKLYFENLASEDSLTVKQALSSSFVVDFKEEHYDQLVGLIESDDFLTYSLFERSSIIEQLAETKNEKVVAYLETIYNNAQDTSTLQLAVLRALSDVQSVNAVKTFTKLLIENTPFTNTQYDINSIFYGFYDSLELTKHLYPEILELTRYTEYKDNIYGLLSAAVDSGVVDSKIYEDHKRDLIREAQVELKRQLSSEENDDDYDYDMYYDEYSERGYSPRYRSGYYGASSLFDYITLLIPYHKETAVKAFFNKIYTAKDDDMKIYTALSQLDFDIPVNDTVWTYFADKDEYRALTYVALKNRERLDLIDTTKITQENMAKSLIYENYMVEDEDTIVFLGKRKAVSEGKEGYVYFYKFQEKDGKYWNIQYTGLQPLDTTEFKTEANFTYTYDRLNELKDLDEQIEEKLEEIRLIGRNRVVNDSYGYPGMFGY